MTTTFKITAIFSILALSACSNSGGFGQQEPFSNPDPGAEETTSVAETEFYDAIGDRVLFAVDQADLTPQSRLILDGQANWLAANPDYQVIIEGHSDERGTRDYNLALGARRADAARSYLISQGVPADRLRVVSYGKERPVAICSGEACYSQNRRAVTVLSDPFAGS